MISFNKEFLPGYFSSIDPETRAELARSYRKVCHAPQELNEAEAKRWVSFIRTDIDQATYIRYPKVVKEFLKMTAQKLQFTRIMDVCHRIKRLSDHKVSSSESSEIKAPSQFLYLKNYYNAFVHEASRVASYQEGLERVKQWYTERLGDFVDFCDQYKERAVKQGEDEQKLSSEIEQVKESAQQYVQSALVEASVLYYLCPEKASLFTARQAKLLKEVQEPDSEKKLEVFLSSNSDEEDLAVLQIKFRFFCQFYDDSTKDLLDWQSFLKTSFSLSFTPDWVEFFKKQCFDKTKLPKIEEWASDPVVKAKLQDLQLNRLYEQAEVDCKKIASKDACQFLLELCHTPWQVERLLHSLSPTSLKALKDPSILDMFQGISSFLNRCSVLDLARQIEGCVSVINRMKKVHFKDGDIKDVLSFLTSNFSFFYDEIEPYTEFLSLSKDEMTRVVKSIQKSVDVKDPHSLATFILYGGSENLYRELEKALPTFRVCRQACDALQTLSDEELQTAKKFFEARALPYSLNKEQVVQIVAVLHNKELCDLLERVKSLPDYLHWNFFGLNQWLPWHRFGEISMHYYLPLSADVRYLLAKYARPFDSAAFFYSSEAVNRLEQDLANAPLSLVPSEVLIRYLASKSSMKDWLEESIETREGVQTRLATMTRAQKEAVTRAQKEAVVVQFSEGAMPSLELMDLFKLSKEDVSPLWSSDPQQESSDQEIADLLQKNKDADPLSLLLPIQGKPITAAVRFLACLLIEATKQTKNYYRRFTSSEDQDLSCQFQLDPFPACLTGLFKKIDAALPSGEMYRNLAHWQHHITPNWLEKLAFEPMTKLSFEQKQMAFELLRIVEKIYEHFPQLRAASV